MGVSDDKVGVLEDEARQRRERLASLKRRREERDKAGSDKSDGKKEALPKPVFRSYKPVDEKLRESVLPDAEPGNVEVLLGDTGAADGTPAAKPDDVDIAQLAPRKPDWDLKRDLAPRLEKLERRTQRAIAELIRERLQRDQRPEDLVDAVHAAAAPPADDDDDV